MARAHWRRAGCVRGICGARLEERRTRGARTFPRRTRRGCERSPPATWTLDRAAHTATHLDRAGIALNSFAKSYIAGRAADAALAVRSVSSVVVNIGGDLVVRGPRFAAHLLAATRTGAERRATQHQSHAARL